MSATYGVITSPYPLREEHSIALGELVWALSALDRIIKEAVGIFFRVGYFEPSQALIAEMETLKIFRGLLRVLELNSHKLKAEDQDEIIKKYRIFYKKYNDITQKRNSVIHGDIVVLSTWGVGDLPDILQIQHAKDKSINSGASFDLDAIKKLTDDATKLHNEINKSNLDDLMNRLYPGSIKYHDQT